MDFFVAAPGHGRDPADRAPLVPVEVDFGGAAKQIFHVGAASCGAYGNPAGIDAAMRRWGSAPLADLAAPAAALARDGVLVNAQQAEVIHLLEAILRTTPECEAIFAPAGALLAPGARWRDRALGDTIERLGSEGAEPFYRGDIAAAVVDWVAEHDGGLSAEDLRGYEAIERAPLRVSYRGRDVFTNPPPIGRRDPAGAGARAPEPHRWTAVAAGDRVRDGGGAGRAHARVSRRPRRGRIRRAVPRLPGIPDGLDDSHLRDRRGRPRVRGDVHERRGIGRRRARARGSTSTTSWARRTSARSAFTTRRQGGGCRR